MSEENKEQSAIKKPMTLELSDEVNMDPLAQFKRDSTTIACKPLRPHHVDLFPLLSGGVAPVGEVDFTGDVSSINDQFRHRL